MRLIIGFLDEMFCIFTTPQPLRLVTRGRAGPSEREGRERERVVSLIFDKETDICGIIGWDLW